MNSQTKRIQVTLETLLESVEMAEQITTRVAQGAGFGDEDCYRIGMAVREGVINAVVYGNTEERSKKVFLTLEIEPARFVIRILDQGPGFNLADVPDPLAEENLMKASGRGILLMRSFMDEFDVLRPVGGGAEVVMSKRIAPPAAAAG